MNNREYMEDIREEDEFEGNEDVVELDPVGDDYMSLVKSKKGKKRRKTSDVWNYFDPVPSIAGDNKSRAKCKSCGITYLAPEEYGTGNLKRHIKACPRIDTRDVGQMLIS